MATLEPNDRISVEQYLERRQDRLQMEQLEDQSIYAMYVRTEKRVLEAARYAASVGLVKKIGTNVLNVALLDKDLKPMLEFEEEINDGLLRSIGKKTLHVVYHGQSLRAEESYLLDYDDGLGMPTVEAAQNIKSPQELIRI